VSSAKTAELIEMPFRMWTQVSSRNHVLDEGPDHHIQRGSFDRKKLVFTGNGWLKEQDQQFFNNSI